MSWFNPQPEDLAREALHHINKWWDSIDGETNDFHVLEFGRLTVYLFGSVIAGQREYNKRYGHTKRMPSTLGFNVVKGLKEKPETLEFDIWLPFKKDGINPWDAGHEIAHIFQYLLHFKNPDKITETDYCT